MSNRITEALQAYEHARRVKEDAEAVYEASKKDLERLKMEAYDAMLEEDLPSVEFDGYTYAVSLKTKYSFRNAEELFEELGAEKNKFDVLRENGLDWLIKETVDPRTLNSAITEMADSEDGIPEELSAIIRGYDVKDLSRRKAARKGAR